jgi:ISXO2-like transposase domain
VMVRTTLFQCSRCRRQTSATAGTVFQDTRKPLVLWFRAMWYVMSQKNGASALGLQRVLGLGSYETAWTWLHKLRRAMVRPDRDRLSGWVEVDETLVGGLEEGVSGRQTETKVLVVIAAEVDGPGIGRIRMRRIEDASAGSLHAFVGDCVEPGSTIHTDGWQGYAGLESKGYDREVTVLRGRKKEASKLLPRVRLALEAVVARHPPGRSGTPASAVLPGRIHLSLQSKEVQEPGQTLLSPHAAGRDYTSSHL